MGPEKETRSEEKRKEEVPICWDTFKSWGAGWSGWEAKAVVAEDGKTNERTEVEVLFRFCQKMRILSSETLPKPLNWIKEIFDLNKVSLVRH